MEEKDIEKVQEELKYKIITLEDENEDSKVKKFLEEIIEEMNQSFDRFKAWYDENKNSEKAQEMKTKFLDEMNKLVTKATQLVEDVRNNPELQEKFEASKETIAAFSKKAMSDLKTGVNTILDNETVAKTINSVSDSVVEVIHDERVQKGIKATKKGILNVATSAFEGLKNVLGEKED